MKTLASTCLLSWLVAGAAILGAQAPQAKSPQEILSATLAKVAAIIEPAPGAVGQTFSARLRVAEAEGEAKLLAGQSLEVAFQAPDRFRLSTAMEGRPLVLGRDRQELWINAPAKQFGLLGSPDVPRFGATPDRKDGTQLKPVRLPLPKEQFLLLGLLMQVDALGSESVANVACQVLKVVPHPQAAELLRLPKGELRVWVRESDGLPARLAVANEQGLKVQVQFENVRLGEPLPDATWKLSPGPGAKLETVALGHLTRFIPAALSLLDQRIPTLGPATGERKLLATEGDGRLEEHDGTKVLFLKGSAEAMGRQHGVLMRKQIRDLVGKVLYGVGVGSSFEKGRWFLGEIEAAQRRLKPFIDERYLREMDALAAAAGLESEEVRLANFFPELFHCSGFALYGAATVGGRMYHGRILDYLKGVGLEPNAVVIVHQPDYGHAWVNVSYAGFVGSVTAMNEKQVSIGEMGGRGEGEWDGKPMAQLVREVMEKADSLEEAVEIMRKGPRTCEYYYVIADGKTKRAVGIAATPTRFEVVRPGETHPQLPHAIQDAVLLSAGDRYEALVRRVRDQYGRLDDEGARRLMDRPVCMNSNIHSVLFGPDTLDFWVANADAKHVASHTRYTHYNLRELLKQDAPKPVAAAGQAAGTR